MFLSNPPEAEAAVPRLGIVVPCYNEEAVVDLCAAHLQQVLGSLIDAGKVSPASYLLFVDDGSTDGTWSGIESLHRRCVWVHGLKLSRNRGHQNALVAGLLSAKGDIVVSVDADLQDDLSIIGQMVDAHAAGAEIVLGVRRSRGTDTPFKRGTAAAFYKCLRWLDVRSVPNHADYRLMGRRAIEALRQYGEANLFLRALILELGFTTTCIFYDRAERAAGISKYPLRKMVALAVDGITSFSTKPLRLIALAGLGIAAASFAMGCWALLSALVLKTTVQGWASLMVSIYFVCGVQMVALGIIGEYVGKIYLETKRRPRFVVERELGNHGEEGLEPAGSQHLASLPEPFRAPPHQ